MTSISDHSRDIPILTAVRAAANKLAQHPQDHGWRDLYRLIGFGLSSSSPQLRKLFLENANSQRDSSATHLITLLGISLKIVAVDLFDELRTKDKPESCLDSLEAVLAEHGDHIAAILSSRRNSFTGARRFLVPQVVLGAYFANGYPVDFADLGTGLGVLPRQLNAQRLYNTFKTGLRWAGGTPSFQPIPLRSRFGVDQGPLPRIDWVRACYGTSPYYEGLYRELMATFDDPDVRASEVGYSELDLLDTDDLRAFIRRNNINAVNLSYTLYELTPESRTRVIDTLLDVLRPPGVAIVTEPHAELTRPGCTVTVYDQSTASPMTIVTVSDGHFTGRVDPLPDYEQFTTLHPITYEFAR
ncbi:hypothetical protein [Umezawaea sp. Da 62-37]|uniref:hypothetical protein n=1 Tax=Umezawaea sp. Da 62-37 TaxID=3075927 RepID=UPI0028F6E2D5|nr:hypothetical protein [Umezawaea sp. Da 62-37]WNV88532.1 hypothetical protein RM788_09600 [Umezawaea sp. Da 62-37]